MKLIRNPFTNKLYTKEQIDERKKMMTLACADSNVLANFDAKYKKYDAIVFKAGTGTGKGVIITTHVMELENLKTCGKPPKPIIVTEPRTTNAQGSAIHLQKFYGDEVVNYGYRFNNNLTETTLLNFVTDGFLVNFFYNDPYLKKYSTVIIDEVHERNKNIDQVLAFCRMYKKKMVLLSATIDVAFYVSYLAGGNLKVGNMELSKVTTYPIEDIYMPSENDYINQAINIIKTIVEAKKPGDIIIFLSSASECVKACRKIRNLNFNLVCYEFHSGNRDRMMEKLEEKDNYKKDLVRGNVPERKIIFSTNVAESGVTIPGLKYVIDSGRRYESIFVGEEGLFELKTTFVSKSESDQRRGRVGRVESGINYRLFSENEWKNEFPEYKDPEILVDDVSELVLSVLGSVYGENKIQNVWKLFDNMPNPPTKDQRNFAIDSLKSLALITNELTLTKLGKEVTVVGKGLHESIVAIMGASYKITYKIAQMLAMFLMYPEIEKWFDGPNEHQANYDDFQKKMSAWSSSLGEIFVLRDIFSSYMEIASDNRESWCNRNYLNYRRLAQAEINFKTLLNKFSKITPLFEPPYGEKETDLILKCFIAGYKNNIGIYKNGVYEIDRPVGIVKVDKPLNLKKLGKKIIFTDIAKINGKVILSGIINID